MQLKQTIKQEVEEQLSQDDENEILIVQLTEQNQQLQDLLKINYSDEQINQLQEKISAQEDQFYSQYVQTEQQPTELEIQYLSKKKSLLNNPSKKFNQALNPRPRNNALRGDIVNLQQIIENRTEKGPMNP